MKGNTRFVQVYVDVASNKLDKPFTYLIPDGLSAEKLIGMRVLVPFGPRTVEGYVTESGYIDELPSGRDLSGLKEVIRTLDKEPVFCENMLQLARWIADHYLCTYVQALQCVMPTGIKVQGKKFLQLTSKGQSWLAGVEETQLSTTQERIMELMDDHGGELEKGLINRVIDVRQVTPAVTKLLKIGYVLEGTVLASRVGHKKKGVLELTFSDNSLEEVIADLGTRAAKQAGVLRVVASTPGLTVTEAAAAAGTSSSTVQALVQKGLIQIVEQEVWRDPSHGKAYAPSQALVPTQEQQQALQQLFWGLQQGKGSFLLHGVTGSGKTEVYLQAIAKAMELAKQAIVLVPEISLTPQIVSRFKSRFGSKVAVLHSRLSLGERYDEWRRIKQHQVEVVVGARSAVFAPFDRLGLIIIDEEHETSYKQEDQPRYHARSVALKRAELEGAVVVLGSATPEVDTYYKALQGQYTLLNLLERVDNRPLPEVEVIDMRRELAEGNRSIFSSQLAAKIADRLQKKEQIILFLNRRGFSTFVVCRECGHVMKCPNCDISLTYHSPKQNLCCHYCDHQEPNPLVCPKCQSKYIRYFGAGTEKVEEELTKEFPQARVLRMDVDTTTRKGAHEAILTSFEQEDADILVGTQMIAKGLDYPNVTLVGVISADTSLNVPDFRSGERTFQLMTQVAGRAGRGQKLGEVIIQTYTPEHYSLLNARHHDYHGFYQEEIELRETLGYPPFSALVRLVVSGLEEQQVINEAHRLAEVLGDVIDRSTVLGPAPAPLSRLRNRYRWHLAIKGENVEQVLGILQQALPSLITPGTSGVRISLDVEPQSMM